ncbi:MAG: AMP-binding protein [Spirochaetaceae bacterium]|jgi:long-chain acyl-CoA synthetase|nr:AMP-binding protein [Spirochaetaceae bacterium]
MLKPEEYMADWADCPWTNFIDFLDDREEKYTNDPAIYYRAGKQKDFTVWTFGKYASECKRIARGLIKAGLKKGDRVALWCENRPEWMAVWMGTAIAGCVIVPIEFLIPQEEVRSILKLTEAKAFFFSHSKADFASELSLNGIDIPTKVQITNNDDFSQFAKDADNSVLPASSEIAHNDPVSIVFTSGTTGISKGVTLSHKGIIANANAAITILRPEKKDTFINVLPLHHTYPTTCSFIVPHAVGAPSIIVERLVGQVVINDIHDAHGTFLIAVPLLYEKLMAGINSALKKIPPPVRDAVKLLRKKALKEAKKGNPEWGRKALRFIRKKAGLDSISIMVAGGGALNPATADFFDSLGFNIVHGYGMSENGPLISVNTPRHKNNISVGLPVKYTDIKILDQDDETKILGFREHGEITVKSPSLMLGYFANPDATAEMFTKTGYLKTGDLGFMDEDGFVYINGRKKNLIVSSGGKNVYPEEIELHFGQSRVVGEILVMGRKEADGENVFAVIFPNMETLAEDYPDKTIDDDFIKTLIKKEIETANRSLVSYKKISGFMLRNTPFEKNAQQKIRRFLYRDYADPEKTPL